MALSPPRLYAEVNPNNVRVEVMTQTTDLNRLIYSLIMFEVREW